MSAIIVETTRQKLTLGGLTYDCVIGKGGTSSAEAKREGDGCTPVGEWPIRAVLLRPGRVILPGGGIALPWRWTRAEDGWSDDPADPLYNRPARLPRTTSTETLQRADQAYDVIVVLGHNDDPPVSGAGSAIFFHIWVPGEDGCPKATEGCVAVAPEAMRAILPQLRAGMTMIIR